LFAVGRVTRDAPRAPVGNPDIACGIGRHAVGRAVVALELKPQALIRERPRGRVEIERKDASRRGVREVHRATVERPRRRVGARATAVMVPAPVSRGEPIGGAAAPPPVEVPRAGPEPAFAIAFPVVETIARTLGFRSRDDLELLALRIEEREMMTQSDDEGAVILALGDGGDFLVE